MKRIYIFLSLVFAAVLAWCAFGAAGDTNKVDTAAIATNATPVNLSTEIARAKSENKLLLLEFASSDSCPPCILLQQHVFSQPQFLDYAKSNLVFVRIDFPQKTQLPPQIEKANDSLAQQFGVWAFPTFIAIDHSGKVFWKQEGIEPNLLDPKEFIALIESVKKKEK